MSNVPKLRFKEFSGEWEEIKLGDIADVSKLAGFEFTKHIEYSDEGKIIALRGLNIKNNGLDLSDVKYIDNSDLAKLSRSKLYINDMMFTYVGTIGETAIIKENDRFFLAPNVSRIRLKNDYNSIIFINQYFNNSRFRNIEIEKYIATSSQPALSMTNIRLFCLKLPSKQEQEKIASFLTSIDIRIGQLTKKEELLQQYKKGVMQKIFNQEIRFKADDGSEFCDWEEKKLSSLCNIKKGSQLNKETLTDKGDYPALNGGVNPSGYTTDWNTESNTITISEGGNSCGYVNFVQNRFWSGGHNYSLQDLKDNIDVRYLFQYLKFNEEAIMRLRVGSGLPNIQKGEISNFKVFVPCLIEQTKIATFLSSIDSKIEQVQRQLDSTTEFKKALLQQMFI